MSSPFDIFGLGADPDRPEESPAKKAQEKSARPLPKRFYDAVKVVEGEGGFEIRLDGRSVKTPARNTLFVRSQLIAEKTAEEWQAQGTAVDPKTMPLTRLLNSALDGVARQRTQVHEEIVRYAGNDLLYYRADGPDRLVERQNQAWDPVLNWLRDHHQCRFILASGVLYIEQPQDSLEKVRALVACGEDAVKLAAFHAMTTLTGSCLLTLAVLEEFLSSDDAWRAAHVDEDWNIEQWGRDDEAHQRRLYRKTEMDAAALILRSLD